MLRGEKPDVQKCGNKSRERNKHLLMGTSVGVAQAGAGGGSLGGFVLLPDNSIGFLTCAHLVDPGNSCDGVTVCQPAQIQQPAHTGQEADDNSLDCCGELLKLASHPGSHDTVGVDAAVVKVTSRAPVDGEFVRVESDQLKHAGFHINTPPKFVNGKISKLCDLSEEQVACDIVKTGGATGLTKGHLYVDGLYVRQSLSPIHTSRKPVREFFNQLEVSSSLGAATRFFDHGDSGALAFLAPGHSDADLLCIGMAIGCTSYGTCVVTPIEAVLDALQLPQQFIDFAKYQYSF